MGFRINIVSPGRFHVCDLARELDKNGWDVSFYSFVPTKRAMKFGLPAKCNKTVLPFVLPFLVLQKYIKSEWTKQLRIYMQDIITSIYMRKCDILIAMSGDFVHTVERAKRHGATIVLERGSKHILEQKRILESIPSLKGTKPVPDANVRRELHDYQNADYIAVASKHVKDSFIKQHFDANKLFVNPYGVDLSMFHPAENTVKEYDVIMVGNWGYQKGCDLIVDAIKLSNYKFLHVGPVSDMPFPNNDTRFTHVDAVDQAKLVDYYAKAKVFVFPSRQDGFGMVLSQAVACNLPIVGSKDCGAPDLKDMVEIPEYIKLIDEYSPQAIKKAIDESLVTYETLKGKIYAGNAISQLTWKAYGERYSNFLNNILGGVNLTILKLYRKYDVIMVGGWSYRKGCDLIVEAIKQSNYRFLHVGSIVDMKFPQCDERFTHIDAVDQRLLPHYYNQTKVFVLPSREEGLAMVQAQAIACNLPMVGSKDSGAEDLKAIVEYPEYITIIKDFTSDYLLEGIKIALEQQKKMNGLQYAGNAAERLTWKAYGKRYSDFLHKISKQ